VIITTEQGCQGSSVNAQPIHVCTEGAAYCTADYSYSEARILALVELFQRAAALSQWVEVDASWGVYLKWWLPHAFHFKANG
jgi:hypothetical protein